MPDPFPSDYVRHVRPPELAGVELLHARYRRHAFASHAHEGYAFGVITHGLERFRYRGADHLAGPMAVVALDPEVVHTGGPGREGGWTYRMVYVSIEAMRGLLRWPEPGALPSFHEPVIADRELAGALQAVGPAVLGATDKLERESALAPVLTALVDRHAIVPERPEGSTTATTALARIREQVQAIAQGAEAAPSLVHLAAPLGLSPTQLLRRYAQAYGLPPHAHIRELRLRRAGALLRAGGTPAGVAVATGFADQSHLTRWFKRRTGVTPAAYARGGPR